MKNPIISDRRQFLQRLGLASTGIAAFLASTKSAEAATAITDVDILQFALNLEYLEAEFYTVAVTGKTIDQTGITITGSGNAGATTGGQKVTFFDNSSLALTAAEIGEDERAHVTLLQKTITSLGAAPIAKPAINLNALGVGFASQEGFVTLARAFEDTGVSAYGGAAPLISSSSLLGYAARILATEAMHAGNIRLHASLYRAATAALDSVDIIPPPSGTQYISVDANGLTAVRTPGQVLSIVFGGPNLTSGAFFPNGVNGTLNTSST